MNRFDEITGVFAGSYNPQVAIDGSLMLRPFSTDVELPEVPEGYAAIFDKESNTGNLFKGSWRLVVDNRGKDCWDTVALQKSKVTEFGDLTEGKTLIEPDCEFPKWDGVKWVVDEVAKLDHDSTVERTWRNRELMLSSEAMHDDFPGTDKPSLLAYRQLLRDWPQSDKFPDSAYRPAWPVKVPRPAM